LSPGQLEQVGVTYDMFFLLRFIVLEAFLVTVPVDPNFRACFVEALKLASVVVWSKGNAVVNASWSAALTLVVIS
jgi:hypothetical protein